MPEGSRVHAQETRLAADHPCSESRKVETTILQRAGRHLLGSWALTNQANRRDDGRRAAPPRSVRVERWVRRPRFASCFHLIPACQMMRHGGVRCGVTLYFHLWPSASRPDFARSSATMAIRKRQLALNFRKNGSAKNGI